MEIAVMSILRVILFVEIALVGLVGVFAMIHFFAPVRMRARLARIYYDHITG